MEAERPRVQEPRTSDSERPIQNGRNRMKGIRRAAVVLGALGAVAVGGNSLTKDTSVPDAPAPFSISVPTAEDTPDISSENSTAESTPKEKTQKEEESGQVLRETLKKLGINMALAYEDNTFVADKSIEENADNVTITLVRKAGADTYELEADMQQKEDGTLQPETVSNVEITGLKGSVDEGAIIFGLEISEMSEGNIGFEYNCKDKDPQIGTGNKDGSEDPFVNTEGMKKVRDLAETLWDDATQGKTVPQTPPQLVI